MLASLLFSGRTEAFSIGCRAGRVVSRLFLAGLEYIGELGTFEVGDDGGVEVGSAASEDGRGELDGGGGTGLNQF